jgi:hypothetical protein
MLYLLQLPPWWLPRQWTTTAEEIKVNEPEQTTPGNPEEEEEDIVKDTKDPDACD